MMRKEELEKNNEVLLKGVEELSELELTQEQLANINLSLIAQILSDISITMAMIADQLTSANGSGTQEETNEKTIKIINNLCDHIEGCKNCFYCKDNAQCEPMVYIKELQQGKE
jgi:hypothetical protein